MLKTARPASPPFVCAVTGRASFDEGFIDLGVVAGIDPQVYIAMDAARDVGRLAGMVSADERDQLVAELEAAQEQLDALNGQVEEFEDFKHSVEFTFKGIEKLRRPPGPSPTKRGKLMPYRQDGFGTTMKVVCLSQRLPAGHLSLPAPTSRTARQHGRRSDLRRGCDR